MSPEPGKRSRLEDADGAFAMVAVDQRESLRVMLRSSAATPVDDEKLSAFKVAVARALSPHASALLVDVDYGVAPILAADALDPSCRLIVAVDDISYSPEGAATSTVLRRARPGEVRATNERPLRG